MRRLKTDTLVEDNAQRARTDRNSPDFAARNSKNREAPWLAFIMNADAAGKSRLLNGVLAKYTLTIKGRTRIMPQCEGGFVGRFWTGKPAQSTSRRLQMALE